MTNYFANRKKGVAVDDLPNGKDNSFYEIIDVYLDSGEIENNNYIGDIKQTECKIFPYYNALRNFISKKPFIEDKIRVMFDEGTFLLGWDKDKINERLGFILKKDEKYYIGIQKKKNALDGLLKSNYEDGDYIMLEYKQLGDIKRQVPRIAFPSFKNKNKADYWEKGVLTRKEKYGLTNELIKIKEEYDFKKDKIEKEKLVKLIDYYKKVVYIKYNDIFNVKNIKEINFRGIGELNDYVSNIAYTIKEKYISTKTIKNLLKSDICLFQIYNQDFDLDEEIGKEEYGENFIALKEEHNRKKSPQYIRGEKSLHTRYFKLLFDEKNLSNQDGVIYKLSGGAMVFYRPKSKELEIGKNKIGNEITKNPRYGKNKYFLHLSIVFNYVNKKDKRINDKVNRLIGCQNFDEDKFRIIGIDRGEKHMVYYSVIDARGNIKKIKTLNEIRRLDKQGEPIKEENVYYAYDKNRKVYQEYKRTKNDFKDYYNVLNRKEIERLEARKSWQSIDKIKDLKKGYISQVVNEICQIIIDTINEGKIPIVVFENLKQGFKRNRQKIEKQSYQNLEAALVKKLNYLVSKREDNFLNAWQLTPEFTTFQDSIERKSQVGIVFYVNPDYTSKCCPDCGFIPLKYIKSDQAKDELQKMDISYDGENKRYLFEYEVNKKRRKVHSNVKRLSWDYKKKKMTIVDNVTTEIDNISEIIDIEDKEFWIKLAKLFNLIVQIRNSQKKARWLNDQGEIEESGEDQDFVSCPVPSCNFRSENGFKRVEWNGDANGAYNIAKKGIILIKKIQTWSDELESFRKRWGIKNLPQREDEKIGIIIDNQQYTLSIGDDPDEEKKKVKIYQITKIGSKKLEDKSRKYPELKIDNHEWDFAAQNWDKFVKANGWQEFINTSSK